MKRIFITGMSGTGKSSVIQELQNRGFTAIDTDYDNWCEPVITPDANEEDWIWRESRMRELLTAPLTTPLFVSGCRTNQGNFYEYFDYKVLLSAPIEVILDRVSNRHSNPYGKTEAERAEIMTNFEHVQPLLEKSTDYNLDSSQMSIEQITDVLINLSSNS